uniref:RING-type E3 ubiquitin transferase n=1 Tax=Otus sunia TaxID=257818 RepID=A0A8C8BPT4_9STRI
MRGNQLLLGSGPAESFRDEASCSICLGFFQDPVSIHCGHNFCRACITRCWEEAEENFSCPQCKETAPQRNLRPNRELAKIIEIAKRLSLQAAKGGAGGERLCEKHQEALKLFCEEDQTPICLVCRESQAHRVHTVVPIEEAAEEHKVGRPRAWRVGMGAGVGSCPLGSQTSGFRSLLICFLRCEHCIRATPPLSLLCAPSRLRCCPPRLS